VNDGHNTCGQAYALTVLTPILEGRESSLARHLDALQGGSASPLARVHGTHFARWVVIGDVVYEGGDQRRDHLNLGRLLFTSNFDGRVEPYLEVLRTGLADAADTIWGHCAGYPGSADAAAFAGYLRAHQIESSLFFSAYGERTVQDVTHSLAVRRNVIDFALRAQGLPAAELQAAFRETFGR
jgi:hypothetical protein